MTTTSTDLVNETTRYLYAGARDPMNKLTTALTDTTGTTVILTYDLGAARDGAVLAIDLELMYVWSVDNDVTHTMTVERGVLGSTAATHSAGAIVTVNPKFSQFSILEALNADLDDLSANGLFRTATVTRTYSPSVDGYDLTSVTDVLRVLEVKYETSGPNKRWPDINSWELKRASDATDFPSTFALVLNDGAEAGLDVRITYAAPFSRFTALAQNIASTTGLPATANDLPPLGAALRLQSVREGQRNFNESQPATRRAGEVQTGAQLVAAHELKAYRRDRIRVETRRLQKYWPAKIKLPS